MDKNSYKLFKSLELEKITGLRPDNPETMTYVPVIKPKKLQPDKRSKGNTNTFRGAKVR